MEARKRHIIYKQVNRDRDKLTKRFVPLWERALKEQTESYNFATDFIDIEPVRKALQINYVSVGGKFALQTAKQILGRKTNRATAELILKGAKQETIPPLEDILEGLERDIPFTLGEIDVFMIRLVNEQFAEKIVGISETTRSEIQKIIQEQLDLGKNPRDSARIIAKRMADINKSRALTIARTESIGASNAGSDAGAQALNIPLKKTWQAAFINTRDTHSNASGQVRTFDSPFTVGGFQMRRPHDGSLGAPAEEIVNCRCISIKEAAI